MICLSLFSTGGLPIGYLEDDSDRRLTCHVIDAMADALSINVAIWRLADGWQLEAWDESGQRWVVEVERLYDGTCELAGMLHVELDDGQPSRPCFEPQNATSSGDFDAFLSRRNRAHERLVLCPSMCPLGQEPAFLVHKPRFHSVNNNEGRVAIAIIRPVAAMSDRSTVGVTHSNELGRTWPKSVTLIWQSLLQSA